MLLSKVIKNLDKKYKNIKFNNISFNSKNCKINDIFFAIKGNKFDGNKYIKDAINKGAKIIISNLKFTGFNKEKILFINSKNPRKLLSEVASKIYKQKPKNIIGVTGTNGKTSVANFYYQILKLNNKKVAAIGTLGVLSDKINFRTNNTTIDPINIHRILKKFKESSIENIIIEASSHGLKQYRLNGINFKTAIFTNLSQDHIDYHKTLKDYLNSKLILFSKLLTKNGNIIFDDKIKEAKFLNKITKHRKLIKYSYGKKNSFIKILDIQKINDEKKITFKLKNKIYVLKTSLIGEIQIKNLIFAIIAAHLSRLKIKDILKTIHKIKTIPGRIQKIGKLKNKSKVFLDYAHTPDALKTVIFDIKKEYPLADISLVFGCGGERDKKKRPIMGSIASKFCHKIYLTDDNPRNENPKEIRNNIRKGIGNNKFFEIASRKEAIFKAVNDLKSGDVLIVTGKGHETYQEYKKKKFFSDKIEILKAIRNKNFILSNSIKTNTLKEQIPTANLNKKININSATMNSKKISKNSIFIGVQGKRFDGNKFSNDAINNGALIALSNKRSKNSKIVYAKNPLGKLQTISSNIRKTLDITNIAITGSAGKTSLKELVGFCLTKISKTFFSKKSLNNKFGVPISLFNVPQNSKFCILEVGMDKKGEIDFLSKMIKPNVGVITNISYAHIKNFKNLNQIAYAKGEIIKNIIPKGILVINKDDKYFNYFRNEARKKDLKIISFSIKDKNADVTFIKEKKFNNRFIVTLKINKDYKKFIISKELVNFKHNIVGAVGIIANFFEIEKMRKDLFLDFKIPQGRGSEFHYKNKKKIIKILDESYNSNPLSLKFSLAKYDDAYKDKKNKHILIGDMLELGRFSKKLHIQIAKYINKSKVSKVHVYGKYIKHTYNKLKPQIKGKYLRNSMEILNLIKNELPNKAILMVKGSNSTGLNKIIQSFKNK